MARRHVVTLLLAMALLFSTSGLLVAVAEDRPSDSTARVTRLLRAAPDAFAVFFNDAPLDSTEWRSVLRWMYVLRKTPAAPGELARLSAGRLTSAAYGELLAGSVRGARRVWTISGRVTWIEKIKNPLPDEVHLTAAERQLKQGVPVLHVCRVRLDGGGGGDMEADGADREVLVLVQDIPRPWRVGVAVDYRTETVGVFLKVLPVNSLSPRFGDGLRPVFLAGRLAWYDDSRLGGLGMDVGLLEDVYVQPLRDARGERLPLDLARMRLTAEDRDAFYAMLAAVGRAQPGQLERDAREQLASAGREAFSVVPLFNRPASQQGRLVELVGKVRRANLVRVTEPDIRQRFGIDHYYQLYVYTDQSQGNPLVVCVRDLPEAMPLGEGPDYSENVRVAAFFFKTWAYRAAAPDEAEAPAAGGEHTADRQWRLAPLLIGKSARWIPPSDEGGRSEGPVTAGVLVAMILVGLVLWRALRRSAGRRGGISEVIQDCWFRQTGDTARGAAKEDQSSQEPAEAD